jgi:anti-anti-sigma factor
MPLIRWESDGAVRRVFFTEEKILDELVIRQVQDELIQMLQKMQEPDIVLDCRFVKFLSSAALGMLIRVNKRCKEFKISLKLCNIDKEIEKVFRITGLKKILSIYPGDPPDPPEETGVFAKLKPRPPSGTTLRIFDPEDEE